MERPYYTNKRIITKFSSIIDQTTIYLAYEMMVWCASTFGS